MHNLLFVLNALWMIALPLIVATFIERRWRTDWGLFGVGAATFVLSQVLHIPFNVMLSRLGILPSGATGGLALLWTAIVLGLSAGVFEEVGRYVAYRYWVKDARTWAKGMMLGAGHGGIEAMLLGFLALVNVLFLFAFQADRLLSVVPAEQMPLLQSQLDLIFSANWYDTILGAVERTFTMAIHLALSVLVLQLFLRGQRRWLFLAILYHALVDALAVYTLVRWNTYIAEGTVFVMALVGLGIIAYFYQPNPVVADALPVVESPPAAPVLRPIEPTKEKLDESRYG